MSDFTDEEVTAGMAGLNGLQRPSDHSQRGQVRAVLAAVLPAHDRHVKAETLREAADYLEVGTADDTFDDVDSGLREAARRLRRHADAIENGAGDE